MDDFERIEGKEFFMKCKKCGEIVRTGIVNISDHWVNCNSSPCHKQFYDALISNPKGAEITIEDIIELKRKYLKYD